MLLWTYPNFYGAINSVITELRQNGSPVTTESWQAVQKEFEMYELCGVSIASMISSDLGELRKSIKPNLPWADDHFLERVGGKPLNPGEQWKEWPYYKNNPNNDKFRTENDQFSHTYMERFWPKFAGASAFALKEISLTKDGYAMGGNYTPLKGIRYVYGDLNDVITLLLREPHTRQAYMPIWFPEDTGATSNQRVPCTLGYLFMRRGNQLNITYYIRSCDYFRHFRDDIYLACRLLLEVLDRLKHNDPVVWADVKPGVFKMHIESLHIFLKEYNLLKNE